MRMFIERVKERAAGENDVSLALLVSGDISTTSSRPTLTAKATIPKTRGVELIESGRAGAKVIASVVIPDSLKCFLTFTQTSLRDGRYSFEAGTPKPPLKRLPWRQRAA